jgi:N-acetylglucosamine-6-phosphate deacetylase
VASQDTYDRAISTCEAILDAPKQGARIMGLHLEGNYLNPSMLGAQDPAFISLPDPDVYGEMLNRTRCIKRWTAAPELEGALAFGRYATERGVLVSVGHTTADYPRMKAAVDAGYRHITHFYNAMTGVHKQGEFKHEGAIESVYLLRDRLTVELVGDGIHVPPALMRLVYELMGPERVAMVTDSMMAAACPGRVAEMYGGRVIIEDGVCKLADRSAIAGSIATMSRTIRVLTEQVGIPLLEAVRMASGTPARIMGIDNRKGTLEKGKDADIILFDSDIRVLATFVEGKLVHDNL